MIDQCKLTLLSYKIKCQTFLVNSDGSIDLNKDKAKKNLKSYLVGKPLTYCCSQTGRATKGYVAFDVDNVRLVFLKDVWRAVSSHIHPELDTYIKLNGDQVRRVPTGLGGGDVGVTLPQLTLTEKYLTGQERPRERAHGRLILKELGRPLESYHDSPELMVAVMHAITGECFPSPLASIAKLTFPTQHTVKRGRSLKFCTETSVLPTFSLISSQAGTNQGACWRTGICASTRIK